MNARKEKSLHLFRPGDTGLYGIFDPQFASATCERVADLCGPSPAGWRKGIAKTCRELLLAPITEFVARLEASTRGSSALEHEDSDRFRKCIERLVSNIEFSDGHELSRAESEKWAIELKERWSAFIAVTSAYRIYDDMRRDVDRRLINQNNAKKPRTSKRARDGDAKPELTADSLLAVRVAFAEKYKTDKAARGWQQHAALHFGVSASTINRKAKEFLS